MKIMRMFLIATLVLGLAATSFAVPVTNTAGDGFEDLSGGAVYGYYQNSGTLLFMAEGNNQGAHFSDMQAALNAVSGFSGVVLAETGVTSVNFNNDGTLAGGASNSGTWATDPISNTISFYAIKAGDFYAMYVVDPAASTGSWSTYDIWKDGFGMRGNAVEISHFNGYNAGTSVPEPSTLLLFGSGLLGLGFFGTRKFRK